MNGPAVPRPPPAESGAPGKEPRSDANYHLDPPRQELLPEGSNVMSSVTPEEQPDPPNDDNAWWTAVITAVQPAIYGERWTPWIRLLITAAVLLGIWLALT